MSMSQILARNYILHVATTLDTLETMHGRDYTKVPIRFHINVWGIDWVIEGAVYDETRHLVLLAHDNGEDERDTREYFTMDEIRKGYTG